MFLIFNLLFHYPLSFNVTLRHLTVVVTEKIKFHVTIMLDI